MHPDWDDLAARARELAAVAQVDGRRALIGVVGLPGAGKSTLAEGLVRRLGEARPGWAAHVPMDGFHLADVQLVRLGRAGRKGAPDTFDADGYAALLRRLARPDGRTVYAPQFERDLEQPVAGAIAVEPGAALVVSEGNYLLLDEKPWTEVGACFDEVWFAHQPEEQRRERLRARHVRFGKTPEQAREWEARSDQTNADLIRPSQTRADLVVTLD